MPIDLRRRGLPCRAEGCFAVFRRAGDEGSMVPLQLASADRDEHERRAHGLVLRGLAGGERRTAPLTRSGRARAPDRSGRDDIASHPTTLRRRLLDLLRGGPMTLPELADAVGARDKAVRRDLKVLLAAELVRVEANRTAGRGRPRYQYALTPDARTLVLGTPEASVRELLIDARAVGGEKLIEEIFDMRCRRLARRYRARMSGSLKDQVGAVKSLLEEYEGEVRAIELANDSFVLSVRGCRIFNLQRGDPRVGKYQLALLRELLRVAVTVDEQLGREDEEWVYAIGMAARHARTTLTATADAASGGEARADAVAAVREGGASD